MNKAEKSGTVKRAEAAGNAWVVHPLTGNILAVLAGLAFMFVCMILPLVGQAGTAVPYAAKNFRAFLLGLLVALVLSAIAVLVKTLRSRADGSGRPWMSWGLLASNLGLLLALVTGLLSI